MPKLLLLCLCCLASVCLYAQPKGYKPVANQAAFQQALQKSTTALQSIQSDFVQTKHLSLLADKITSKGRFFYRKEDKVRIEYTTPFQYLVVMNGGRMMVKDEQKTAHINAGSSKTMQSVNRIMLDCMRGTVFSNPDFKVTVYENGSSYLLSLSPANEAIRKLFRQIDIYLARASYDVERLNMAEQGSDNTEMAFSHTLHNTALNDALFKTN